MTATRQHRAKVTGLCAFARDTQMLLWATHGTPYEEDVYVEFGMNVEQFHRRSVRIVGSLDGSVRDDTVRNLLDEARRYLEQTDETR